jgi:serine/threonine protein kinase
MAEPEPARPPDPTLVLLSRGTPAPASPREHSAPQPEASAETSGAAPDPRIGSVLKDTYQVLRKLGEGGMGSVYLAEHRSIRKKVAIKVLGSEYVQRPELAERFLREARAAAMIESPNVIEIHDFGTTPDGAAFFVMEYLHGEDLADLTSREGALPWPRTRAIILQICSALQAAHDRGIVHRDMKPGNCFRLERGEVEIIKVLDFGIAKVATDDPDGGRSLTRTGMIFGTPEYMSPEQAMGAAHDHRVDIYATGVILYQLVTGELPFHADNFMGLLNKHMFEAPPRPSAINPSAAIPAGVEAIILKALQKDRTLRFQTMAEFAAAVAAIGTGAPPVVVVPEKLPQPPRPGELVAFREADTAPAPSPTTPIRWRLPLVVGLLVATGTALALLLGADEPEAPTPPATVATNPDLLPPDPPRPQNPTLLPLPNQPPTPPADPPPVPKVSLQIRTGTIVATVLDGEGRELGTTAAPEGVAVPRGATKIPLVLRADGYQDLRIEVVPDRDQALDRALRRKPPTKATKPDPTPPPTKKPPGNSDLMPL